MTNGLGFLLSAICALALYGCASQPGGGSPAPPSLPSASSPSARPAPPTLPNPSAPPAGAIPPPTGRQTAPEKPTGGGGKPAAASSGKDSSQDSSKDEASGAPPGASSPPPPEGAVPTPGERQSSLDRQLEDSLTEFDGMMLREQELLAERRPETSGGGASGTATGAAAGSGGGAGSTGGSGSAGGTTDDDGVADSATGQSPDADGGGRGPQQDRDEQGNSEKDPRIPSDIPDGADDDIIARQLREAAMQEEDPELRERLWQEYRDYKNASGGKNR